MCTGEVKPAQLRSRPPRRGRGCRRFWPRRRRAGRAPPRSAPAQVVMTEWSERSFLIDELNVKWTAAVAHARQGQSGLKISSRRRAAETLRIAGDSHSLGPQSPLTLGGGWLTFCPWRRARQSDRRRPSFPKARCWRRNTALAPTRSPMRRGNPTGPGP